MFKAIPSSFIKRVEQLEKEESVTQLDPVIMVPRLTSACEWEAIARPAQKRLKENVKDRDNAVDYSDLPKQKLIAIY